MPGAAPQGYDVRDDPRFEALQQTLAALSSPNSVEVDWDRVADLASDLLTQAGKDLLVASYLAGALLQNGGLAGLAEGLGVLADMIDRYWQTMYPPLTRVRGRRNALQWLLDRIDRVATEQQWEALDPQPPELIALLQMQATRLEQALAQHDPDGPSLNSLLASLSRLPMQEGPKDAAATPTATSSGRAAMTANRSDVGGAMLDAPPSLGDASLEVSLAATQEHLFRLADALLAADARDPRAYRLNRVAAWFDFGQLPPNEDGETRITAPMNDVVEAATRLRDGGLDMEMVRFAEAQLPAFPCWLDLQYWAGTALERMGDAYAPAQQAVKAATQAWLLEVPGVVSERFSNGMPFASEESVAWLKEFVRFGEPTGVDAEAVFPATRAGRPPRVTPDATLARARQMAVNGELDAAIALVQAAISNAARAQDRLRARIALCELLCEYRPSAAWRPLAQATIDDIEHHDLEVWDPSLALAGWSAAYAVFRQGDDEDEKAARLLARIARIDATVALQLLNQR